MLAPLTETQIKATLGTDDTNDTGKSKMDTFEKAVTKHFQNINAKPAKPSVSKADVTLYAFSESEGKLVKVSSDTEVPPFQETINKWLEKENEQANPE